MAGDHSVASGPDHRRQIAVVSGNKRQGLPNQVAVRILDDTSLFDGCINLDGWNGKADRVAHLWRHPLRAIVGVGRPQLHWDWGWAHRYCDRRWTLFRDHR